MQIIRNLNQIKISLPDLALTIGNFDGVHLGHLQILSEVKKIAKEKKLSSAVLTFEPHPITFLKADKPRDFRIGSLAQKLKIFKEQQIDFVIILPFNQKFSVISADDFIEEILAKILNVKHLTIGYDFIFGKNRQGNFQLLEEKSEKLGFDLSEISAVKIDEQTCSSSLIRKLIVDGKITEANKFLGRNFTIAGIVTNGRKLASQLGFPTANLVVKPHMMKLKFGVYKTETFILHLGKKFPSITNFGIKPTISGDSIQLFETHILNFNENLYGKKIFVEFIDFIRDEKKFSSIEELKKQILIDVRASY